jgi:tetratricopeptide (TPR) repeat protein
MFFPRLRRQAKWAFAVLAVIFALGFLVAGVGTGLGSGIGDYIAEIFNRQPQAGDQPSVEEARERAAKNPNDASAQLALANALQADGRTDEAIAALERYTARAPRDADALQQLASLYELRARDAEERAGAEAAESQATLFVTEDLRPSDNRLAAALFDAPISTRLEEETSARAQEAFMAVQDAYRKEASVYRKLTALLPDDPSMFFDLGRTSQFSGDIPTAIRAYERFLALAPDDPNAPIVRQQLKLLRAQGAAG